MESRRNATAATPCPTALARIRSRRASATTAAPIMVRPSRSSGRCGGCSNCFLLAVFETCGGPGALELMKNPNPGAVPVTSAVLAPSPSPTSTPPSSSGTWTAAGCAQDGGARALTGYTFATNSMTPTLCQNTCASKGFSIAGVEYSSECYCTPLSLSFAR